MYLAKYNQSKDKKIVNYFHKPICSGTNTKKFLNWNQGHIDAVVDKINKRHGRCDDADKGFKQYKKIVRKNNFKHSSSISQFKEKNKNKNKNKSDGNDINGEQLTPKKQYHSVSNNGSTCHGCEREPCTSNNTCVSVQSTGKGKKNKNIHRNVKNIENSNIHSKCKIETPSTNISKPRGVSHVEKHTRYKIPQTVRDVVLEIGDPELLKNVIVDSSVMVDNYLSTENNTKYLPSHNFSVGLSKTGQPINGPRKNRVSVGTQVEYETDIDALFICGYYRGVESVHIKKEKQGLRRNVGTQTLRVQDDVRRGQCSDIKKELCCACCGDSVEHIASFSSVPLRWLDKLGLPWCKGKILKNNNSKNKVDIVLFPQNSTNSIRDYKLFYTHHNIDNSISNNKKDKENINNVSLKIEISFKDPVLLNDRLRHGITLTTCTHRPLRNILKVEKSSIKLNNLLNTKIINAQQPYYNIHKFENFMVGNYHVDDSMLKENNKNKSKRKRNSNLNDMNTSEDKLVSILYSIIDDVSSERVHLKYGADFKNIITHLFLLKILNQQKTGSRLKINTDNILDTHLAYITHFSNCNKSRIVRFFKIIKSFVPTCKRFLSFLFSMSNRLYSYFFNNCPIYIYTNKKVVNSETKTSNSRIPIVCFHTTSASKQHTDNSKQPKTQTPDHIIRLKSGDNNYDVLEDEVLDAINNVHLQDLIPSGHSYIRSSPVLSLFARMVVGSVLDMCDCALCRSSNLPNTVRPHMSRRKMNKMAHAGNGNILPFKILSHVFFKLYFFQILSQITKLTTRIHRDIYIETSGIPVDDTGILKQYVVDDRVCVNIHLPFTLTKDHIDTLEPQAVNITDQDHHGLYVRADSQMYTLDTTTMEVDIRWHVVYFDFFITKILNIALLNCNSQKQSFVHVSNIDTMYAPITPVHCHAFQNILYIESFPLSHMLSSGIIAHSMQHLFYPFFGNPLELDRPVQNLCCLRVNYTGNNQFGNELFISLVSNMTGSLPSDRLYIRSQFRELYSSGNLIDSYSQQLLNVDNDETLNVSHSGNEAYVMGSISQEPIDDIALIGMLQHSHPFDIRSLKKRYLLELLDTKNIEGQIFTVFKTSDINVITDNLVFLDMHEILFAFYDVRVEPSDRLITSADGLDDAPYTSVDHFLTTIYSPLLSRIPVMVIFPNTTMLDLYSQVLSLRARVWHGIDSWKYYSPLVLSKTPLNSKYAGYSIAIVPNKRQYDDQRSLIATSLQYASYKAEARHASVTIVAIRKINDIAHFLRDKRDVIPDEYHTLLGITF